MSLASREDLLGVLSRGKRRFRHVELPVSEAKVRIRSLTEREVADYERKMIAKNGRGVDASGMKTANRRLFALCLVDAQGNRLLRDDDVNDLADMDSLDSSVLYEACTEHCGINRTDIGELEKNSETTSEDSSPSD